MEGKPKALLDAVEDLALAIAPHQMDGGQRKKVSAALHALVDAILAASSPVEASGMVERLREAIEPYKDHHGPLPDFDSPVACVFDAGVQYAVELLAKELGVEDWTPCDGTEEYDGDLGGTLMNIVREAMPFDRHGERMWPSEVVASLSASSPSSEQGRG